MQHVSLLMFCFSVVRRHLLNLLGSYTCYFSLSVQLTQFGSTVLLYCIRVDK